MAITWGSEVKNSTGNGMRIGYEFSQSPSSVGAGTSSVTVTVKLYVWTRASVFDSTNSFTVGGNYSSSGAVSISHSSTDYTLVRTLSRTVSTSYSGTVKTSVSASLTGINAIPGTCYVSGSWTTGKRPISAPAAPSSVVVSRSSDTRHLLSWNAASSPAGAPVTNQTINRWDSATGAYRTIATVGGSTENFTDSSTVGNNQYRYAIRSTNSAGVSSWAYSDYIATTPAAPTSLKAQKQGSDILVTWSLSNVRKSDGIEIWFTQDGVDLPGGSQAVVLTGRPTSWTHASPDPSTTWAYRLKATETADASNETGPKLYSAYSARSNTAQLLAPPNAPTKLVPSAIAVDALDEQVFTWQHNAVDTTDQTGYDLQYRVDGGAWTMITDLASGISRRTFPAGTFTNGTTLEWQVRTYGDYPTPSPWSTIAAVTVSARPSATVLFPDGSAGTPTVSSSRITAEWDYFDPEGTTQVGARLRLENSEGSPVWSTTLDSAASSYQIPYSLADGAAYTLFVAVRDGSGLWSFEASQPFDVVYAKPAPATITANWDIDLGGVVVNIEHAAPDVGEVAAVSADLQRSIGSDEWETILEGLPPTTTIVDFIPALDTINSYRVISYSDLPSSLESASVNVQTDSENWVFVNGGADWSYICRIRDRAQTTHTPRRAKVLNQYAGRRYPVETTGEQRTRNVTLTGRLTSGSTRQEWEALADMPGPVCYREPGSKIGGGAGPRIFASLQELSISTQQVWEDVTMSFEQVEEV